VVASPVPSPVASPVTLPLSAVDFTRTPEWRHPPRLRQRGLPGEWLLL